MTREDLSKGTQSLDVANLVLESGAADDAVNRAYYSVFHTARALVGLVESNSGGKTHKSILSAFSKHYVLTEKLPREYGAKINKAMSARLVADYEGNSITSEEAETHIAFAQELLERALEFIPPSEHPERRLVSLADAMRGEAVKMALAKAFCELVERRNEILPRGFAEDLALYGDTEKLTELIAGIDTMNDLQSYVLAMIPVPYLD